ncbi:tetratricopeptide repeat-containing protein [Providencia stuartii]|nr:tetratricopeptide repeat-containing protein [Providencia stuartii]MTB80307.1 tetratricopeptide repeat-containing protein [Providencia stuartii]
MKLKQADIPFAIDVDAVNRGPFPINGFLPLMETDFGNGDYYGMYWPLGRENKTPIVCELYHDEGRVCPAFSNLTKLTQWLEANDNDVEEIMIDDPQFAGALFLQAQKARREGRLDDAIHYCQLANEALPEVSEYWLTLASLYQQTKQPALAASAGLNSYLSNWGFGLPNDKVIYFLKLASTLPEYCSDPVVKRVALGSLNLNFGGMKINHNYDLMKECIDEYFKKNEILSALKLSQNYAIAMYAETYTFQERYHFSITQWQNDFSELCLTYLGNSRTTITLR